MNIIELAKNRDEIMASQKIYCHICGDKQFSPFDKLFTMRWERCVSCTFANELESKSENIFKIINA